MTMKGLLVLGSVAIEVAAAFVAQRPLSLAPLSRGRRLGLPPLSANGGGKKKKSKRAAQTSKGFGAPPLPLDDVLAAFKTRAPENADAEPCPCGSGESYAGCCGPLHRGERVCSTMTDVLRSRYSAFSWRNIKYVMDTTHETCRDYREDRVAWAKDLHKTGMFDSFEFVKLEPGLEELNEDDENEGFVQFKVTLRAKEDGQETDISERSRFLRDPSKGSWSYASGDVRSGVAGLEDTTLNV
ncbi:hypothetical protein ACHAWF_003800 [Thalassiosira exigua]